MMTHPQFDPIAISIGPVALHWYGLMYFIGFLSFIYFGKKQVKNQLFSRGIVEIE